MEPRNPTSDKSAATGNSGRDDATQWNSTKTGVRPATPDQKRYQSQTQNPDETDMPNTSRTGVEEYQSDDSKVRDSRSAEASSEIEGPAMPVQPRHNSDRPEQSQQNR